MNQVQVKLKSNGPLLLKSDRLANPMAEITKEYAKLKGDTALKKTEEGQLMIAKYEYLAGFYDDEDGIRIPTGNIWKSLVMGARKFKKGKDIEGGVAMLIDTVEFKYDGPKNHEELWETPKFVDGRTVVLNGRARIMCFRPLLKEWEINVDVGFNPNIIDVEQLMTYWETAGVLCRLGTYRTLFGRYTAEVI